MHIAWVHIGTLHQQGNSFHSDIASVRYRMLAPAMQLLQAGHNVMLHAADDGAHTASKPLPQKPDVVVACKAIINGALREQLQACNTPIIFDICDPLIENSPFAESYKDWALAANAISCNTPDMVALMQRYTEKPIHLIPDPCLGNKGAVKTFSGSYEALWYGHPSNLVGLEMGLKQLAQKPLPQPLQLTVLTLLSPPLLQALGALQKAVEHAAIIKLVPWSLPAQIQALQQSSLVWIPQENSPRTRTKSSNRLVEALWAGSMVAASPLPSYQPYREFAFLAENQAEALHQAFSQANTWAPRILAGQSHIEAHDSVFAAGKAWENALQAVHSAAR